MSEAALAKFFEIAAAGRTNTPAEWYEYLEAFHAELPYANEIFTLLRRFSGETSYAVLAKAVVSTGATRILDAGCGDGNLEEELMPQLPPDAQVVGIDCSEAEITISRNRFLAEPRVRFDVGDVRTMPYADESFDCVTAHQFLNLFPTIKPILDGIGRALRAGGDFIFVANRGWRSDQTASWQLLNQAALAVIKEMHPAFVWPLMGDMRIYREEEISQIFEESGGWDLDTFSIQPFNTSALMAPYQVAAIYNRLYLFATVPEKKRVLEAVEKRAQELAVDGLVQVDLPFRLMRIKRLQF
ncbi:MAG: class I SAM-dependent methyltransferase [Candidatus Eremiobacteraeota bacterium]|nr:class I SAM-dependent methyltransferase [Candidatus Eremiobacteraeota bacterium]